MVIASRAVLGMAQIMSQVHHLVLQMAVVADLAIVTHLPSMRAMGRNKTRVGLARRELGRTRSNKRKPPSKNSVSKR